MRKRKNTIEREDGIVRLKKTSNIEDFKWHLKLSVVWDESPLRHIPQVGSLYMWGLEWYGNVTDGQDVRIKKKSFYEKDSQFCPLVSYTFVLRPIKCLNMDVVIPFYKVKDNVCIRRSMDPEVCLSFHFLVKVEILD